jgi:hypothetical protein
MEYVRVTFPSRRTVFVDGESKGQTNRVLRLPPGPHRFDLGAPANYKPASQTLIVGDSSASEPLVVAFTPRMTVALVEPVIEAPKRGRAPRPARRPTAAAGVASTADAAPDRGEPIDDLVFRTPTREFRLDPPSGRPLDRRELQRFAMQWTYVVRNRARWSTLPVSAKQQGDNAREFLKRLGMSEADLETIATDGVLEVVVPFEREERGWEARILPWEYVVSGATRDARHGEPLTVIRRLALPAPPAPVRVPKKVLYVESVPSKLADLYSFESERALVQSNLRAFDLAAATPPATPTPALEWQALMTPTLEELQAKVRTYRPDIIHLAGFDSHQGMRLLRPLLAQANASEEDPPDTEQERDVIPDGYLLVKRDGRPDPVGAEPLAAALCVDGHRPVLVAMSLHNSAARIAAMIVAKGAQAAIGFQDVFDDNRMEAFFGSFYRAWRTRAWRLAVGFREAWEQVRHQAGSVLGTGVVLWSGRPLIEATTVDREKTEPPPLWLPGAVGREAVDKVLSTRVKPLDELNYSLLHNLQPLFEHFTLTNNSAVHNDDRLAVIGDVDVSVTLEAGGTSATFQRRLPVGEQPVDLKKDIHLPLTSELMRSVHESINTSLLVEVTWGRVIYRDTHRVRLLPVDQWRDNDHDGQWLPSFVLPRDPAVDALIEKGQHYVRVLRDDPSAGFEGYQSVDPQAPEPAAEVDRQVQAIWSTIVHELNLGYINPPPSYNSAMDAQRLRTPSMIVKGRTGTCLDLALLMAACCELIDVYPVIFLLKDHAFPGYWREDRFQREFIGLADGFVQDVPTEDPRRTRAPGAQALSWWFRETAYEEITRQVKLGRLVPMESVWLTEHSGFFDAVEGGRDNLKKRSRFHSMLDIARAREAGVTPLPLGGRS